MTQLTEFLLVSIKYSSVSVKILLTSSKRQRLITCYAVLCPQNTKYGCLCTECYVQCGCSSYSLLV